MNISNSNRYFYQIPSIDDLIKTRKRSFSVECDILLSHPKKIEKSERGGKSDMYRYIINYNSLHKIVYKKLIDDLQNTAIINQEIIKGYHNIFWSIFSRTVFSSPKLINIGLNIGDFSDTKNYSLEGENKDGKNISISQNSTNNSGSLNFDFWCVSPANFSFLNIFIITSDKIDFVKFNTEIVQCDFDIYNMISKKDNYTIISENECILCSNGVLTRKNTLDVKNIYEEIKCSFTIPKLIDPKSCRVRIFGGKIEDKHFIFQREGKGKCYGDSLQWIDYICVDKRKIRDKKYIDSKYSTGSTGSTVSTVSTDFDGKKWIRVLSIDYKIPEDISNKYIDICNQISNWKYQWFSYKTGKIIGNIGNNKISLDRILKDENEHRTNFSLEILNGHSIEEREYGFVYYKNLSDDEDDDDAKSEKESDCSVQLEEPDIKTVVRIEVHVSSTQNFLTTLFFNDKTVEYKTLSSYELWSCYRNVMDSKTFEIFRKYNMDF